MNTLLQGTGSTVKKVLILAFIKLFAIIERILNLYGVKKIYETCGFKGFYGFFTSAFDGKDIFIVGSSVLTLMIVIYLFKSINDKYQDNERRNNRYNLSARVCNFFYFTQIILFTLHSLWLLFWEFTPKLTITFKSGENIYYSEFVRTENNYYENCLENTILVLLLLVCRFVWKSFIKSDPDTSETERRNHAFNTAFQFYLVNMLMGSTFIYYKFDVLDGSAPLFRILQIFSFYYFKRLFENFRPTVCESIMKQTTDYIQLKKKKVEVSISDYSRLFVPSIFILPRNRRENNSNKS